MSTNRALSTLLSDMKKQAVNVNTHKDILDVVSMAIQYNGPMTYDNRINYALAMVGAVTIAVHVGNYESPWVLGVGLTLFLLPLGLVFYRKLNIDGFSDDLFEKDMMLDNYISPLPISESLPLDVMSTYSEFDRGNHSREITACFSVLPPDRPAAKYYHFHYVNKRTVVTSNAKGGSTTKTVYHHYDRYGLLFDFGYAHGLSISSDGKVNKCVSFSPAYEEFNAVFTIGANNDHDAARFLKPALQTGLVELREFINGLQIEISPDGQLLIAFEDCIFGSRKRTYGIGEPELFYKELQGHTNMPLLQTAFKIYDLLLKYLNSNFN